jgi:truncated hemoglobin YjbI
LLSSSVEINALKKLVSFTGGVVLFDRLTQGWLEQLKAHLLKDGISQNKAKLYFSVFRHAIKKVWMQGYIREDFTGKVANIKPTDSLRILR